MTNYNDGNWHGWNGGECPVHPKTQVVVAFRTIATAHSGQYAGGGYTASNAPWYSAIAFRVVKEYREARDFWIKDGVSFLYHVDGAIHVREVIE